MEISVLGMPVRSVRMADLLSSWSHGLLIFHNLDTLKKSRDNEAFRTVCRDADLAVIDGQVLRGLVMALWGRRVDKVSGSDFLPAFCCHHADDRSVSLFLLGAKPGVAARAAQSLNAKAGRDIVCGTHSPSFHLLDDDEESRRVIGLINASGADTLAVGLGAPKQELWMARYREELPGVSRMMAVGASLDFESGQIGRAPAWVSHVGLEWAYRLLSEPRRLWRRYLLEGPQIVRLVAASRLRELMGTDQSGTVTRPTRGGGVVESMGARGVRPGVASHQRARAERTVA